MDNVPLVSVHRLQRHIPPVLDCPGGLLPGQPLEALLPLEPVVLRVHMDPDPLLAALVDGVIGQLLDGVQGLAPAADKRPQLLAFQNDLVASLGVQIDLRPGGAAHMLQQSLQERNDLPCLFIIAGLAQIHRRGDRCGFLHDRLLLRRGLPSASGLGRLLLASLRLPLLLDRGGGDCLFHRRGLFC